MTKYHIVLHRAYTITENDIVGWEEEYDLAVDAAIEKAKDLMADEGPEFLDDMDNFVSATVDKISMQ